RSTLFRLQPLGPEAIATLLRRGLAAEGAEAEDEALGHLADRVGGDGRHALTCLEVAVALARAREPDAARPVVTLADAEAALGTKLQRYGRDEHYDVVSAFIKSIRGPTPKRRCTTWPGCSRPGRTPGSSPGGWSSWRARTSARPTRRACWWRRRRPRPSSTSACPRPSSTSPKRSSTWRRRRSPTARRSPSGGRGRTSGGASAARSRCTCGTPTTGA